MVWGSREMPEETKIIYMLLIGDWSASRAHKRWKPEVIRDISEHFIAKYATEDIWYKRMIRGLNNAYIETCKC